ncbi:MAG: hypothetical protein PHI58_06410 [Candidatus Omnitrophica bacterium]|nr:hypothetical protein [Candidatus Omnitrophota bacterium]
MSIIQEALVKAQNKKKNIVPETVAAAKIEAAPEKPQAAQETKAGLRTPARSVFYAALFLAALAFFASKYFLNEPVKSAAPSPEPQINKTIFENTKVFEFSRNALTVPDEFTLSGIVNLEDGPRAIINNSILAEGDRISDAVVVKISDDSAVLKRGDSEITLHLK